MSTREIFTRKPSEADEPLLHPYAKVAAPVTWGLCIAMLAVILASLIWCFWGTVTRSVEISGVVFPENGIRQMKSEVSGLVSHVQVQVGDTVKAGDLIAIVPQQEIMAKIEAQRTLSGADKKKLEKLYADYNTTSLIYAPVSGRVVELLHKGDNIKAGDLVASITSADTSSNEAEIRAYVAMPVAQDLKQGMQVRVYPQFSSGGQYDYIEGLVSYISSYPITETDIEEDLGRFYRSESIPKDDNIIEIRVTLMVDSSSTSLKWTRTKGESLSIDIGTLCAMKVIISEKSPWEKLQS